MELHLNFRQGAITGEGRDWVGRFVIRGRYELDTGKCWWNKQYVGKHHVYYKGYNEGKGIWGVWEIPPEQNTGFLANGGFHIWPEGMADPTVRTLTEEADLPIHVEEPAELVEVGQTFGNCQGSRRSRSSQLLLPSLPTKRHARGSQRNL
jgi:hypothetical protein